MKTFKSFIKENAEDFPIENLKNRRGQIGNQGISSDQLHSILTGIGKMKNVDRSESPDSMIEKFKQDKNAQAAVITHTEKEPINVSELPDDFGFHLRDGHHRATLLHAIGQKTIKAVVKR